MDASFTRGIEITHWDHVPDPMRRKIFGHDFRSSDKNFKKANAGRQGKSYMGDILRKSIETKDKFEYLRSLYQANKPFPDVHHSFMPILYDSDEEELKEGDYSDIVDHELFADITPQEGYTKKEKITYLINNNIIQQEDVLKARQDNLQQKKTNKVKTSLKHKNILFMEEIKRANSTRQQKDKYAYSKKGINAYKYDNKLLPDAEMKAISAHRKEKKRAQNRARKLRDKEKNYTKTVHPEVNTSLIDFSAKKLRQRAEAMEKDIKKAMKPHYDKNAKRVRIKKEKDEERKKGIERRKQISASRAAKKERRNQRRKAKSLKVTTESGLIPDEVYNLFKPLYEYINGYEQYKWLGEEFTYVIAMFNLLGTCSTPANYLSWTRVLYDGISKRYPDFTLVDFFSALDFDFPNVSFEDCVMSIFNPGEDNMDEEPDYSQEESVTTESLYDVYDGLCQVLNGELFQKLRKLMLSVLSLRVFPKSLAFKVYQYLGKSCSDTTIFGLINGIIVDLTDVIRWEVNLLQQRLEVSFDS